MGEDRRSDWNNSVEKRLVDLNSAQLSSDTEQAELRKKVDKHQLYFLGDPDRNIDGLIPDIRLLKNEDNKFNRIFDKDYLGHGGLVAFITYLYDQEKNRQKASEQNSGYKWAFWTVVAGAVIAGAFGLVTQRDQIMKWFPKPHMNALDVKIEKARHPRSTHKIYVRHLIHAAPAEPVPEPEPAAEEDTTP